LDGSTIAGVYPLAAMEFARTPCDKNNTAPHAGIKDQARKFNVQPTLA
jgi:hypothetical protein